MKIVFLVSSLNAGGAERVATTLASAWAESGHQVTLVPTYHPKGACFYPLSDQVRVHWLSDDLGPAARRQPWLAWRKVRALRALVSQVQPDVVVSFLTNVNVMALLALGGGHPPLVVCERTDPVHGRSAGRLLKALRRRLYPKAQAIVVQTPASVVGMRTQVPEARHIVAIANPLPDGLVAQTPVDVSRPATPFLQLAAMGRLVSLKQFDVLIRVFTQAAQRFPHWRLCIWGEGPQREALQAQIHALGMSGRIQLAGRTSTPWQVLQQADAFALTSVVEGFPNVLLEAMALGLPCVATDCPSGPADMTQQGRDALLVPLADEAALQAALERLMGDAALRQRLGAQAAVSVRSRYGLPDVLAQWDTLLSDVQALKQETP